jgi:hypothetical protein
MQTNYLKLNCSFNNLCASSAVTSGLNRETKSALEFSGFEMTSKDSELLTPLRGCLRGLTLFTAEISAEVLVADFFLYVTVLNPPGSGSAVGPEGGIPVAATSL